MKRYACHSLYVSADECHSQSVVELKEDKTVNRFFPLQEEICATEWLGGVIVLSSSSHLEIGAGESFPHFLQRAVATTGETSSLYAWHIADFDFVKKEFTSAVVRLIRL